MLKNTKTGECILDLESKKSLSPKNNSLKKKIFKDKSPLYFKMESTKNMSCICNVEGCENTIAPFEIEAQSGNEKMYCQTCIIKSSKEGSSYTTRDKKTGKTIIIPFFNPNKKLNISSNNKTQMEDFRKIQLLPYSKCPSSDWSMKQNPNVMSRWTKTKKLGKNGEGLGIPCGKVNNIMVVDLDDYKWNEDHPFIQKFGRDYAKAFPTYIQKSAKGGVHLFFQYDERFWNAGNMEIDFLTDRNKYGEYSPKFVVGAGTTIRYSKKDKETYPQLKGDFGTYKVVQNK